MELAVPSDCQASRRAIRNTDLTCDISRNRFSASSVSLLYSRKSPFQTARYMATDYRDLREVRAYPGKDSKEDPASTPKVHGEPQKNAGKCDDSKRHR